MTWGGSKINFRFPPAYVKALGKIEQASESPSQFNMHVLLLGPFPPPQGGVQTNLVAIRKLLFDRGIPCNAINLTRYRRPSHDGVYYPESPLQVLRCIFDVPATIIHLHIGGELAPRLLLLGLICTLLRGRRTVLTFHSGGYPSSPGGKTAGPWTLRGLVLRRFDCLIAINHQLKALFVKFGVPAERIRFILPYSLPACVPDVALPAPVAAFFVTHSQVLLSMGWLEPEYDYPLQIRALASVRRRFPQAGLVILGAGRLESELRAVIAGTGQTEHVLLAGDTPHDIALVALFRSAIFLRTTHYDGDSVSVREALHFGTPVIASDNGMRPPGVHLVPIGDEAAAAACIEEVLANQQQQQPRQVAPRGTDPIEAVLELYEQMQAN